MKIGTAFNYFNVKELLVTDKIIKKAETRPNGSTNQSEVFVFIA